MLNKRTELILVLAIVAAALAATIVVGTGEAVSGDSPSTVGTYLDENSGITFTLYSDGTAEATTLTAPMKEVTIPGEVTSDGEKYTVTSVGGTFGSMSTVVEKVTFAASITELNDGSLRSGIFYEATKLKEVVFEEGSELKYIGGLAFSGCILLQKIELPEGLEEIGQNVFSCVIDDGNNMKLYYNLYSLEEVVLPSTLKEIGEGSLPNLAMTIRLAEGNKSFEIENGILYNAGKTTLIKAFDPTGDITIPSTVKTICSNAFYIQTSDVMSETVYKSKFFNFVENPVKKDPSAGTVTIPSSVTSIGSYAFALYKTDNGVSKTPYHNLIIPSKLDSDFGASAFQYNPFVTEMYIGNGRTVGTNAFDGCTNIKTAYVLQESITTSLVNVTAEVLIVSDKLTNIDGWTIYNWKNLTTVAYGSVNPETGVAKLPSTLKTIGKGVFQGSAIVTLDLSAMEGDIPNDAFNGMAELESIIIPKTIKKIGSNSFTGCTGLTSIVVPEGIELGDGVFKDSIITEGNLKYIRITYRSDSSDRIAKILTDVNLSEDADGSVTIPKDIESIYGTALPNKGITSITLEEGNASFVLQDGVLYTEDMMTLVFAPSSAIGEDGVLAIPDSVETLGIYSLSYLSDLKGISLGAGSSLKTIGDYAFFKSGIQSFVAPKGLEEIGSYAFANTSNLNEVDLSAVEQDLVICGYAFYYSQVVSVKFPADHAVDLGSFSFQNTKLQSVEIQSGTIGTEAFRSCTSLESVEIQSGTIGTKAFFFCTKLNTLYLGAGVTQTASNYVQSTLKLKQIFIMNDDADVIGTSILADHIGTKNGLTIVVPSGSEADYSTFASKYSMATLTVLENGNSFALPVMSGIQFIRGQVSDDSVSYSFACEAGYDGSAVQIKLNDVDVNIDGNRFVIEPAGKLQIVTVSGLQPKELSVNVVVDNAVPTFDSGSVPYGGSLSFNVVPNTGYTLNDLTATIGGTSYKAHNGSWITIPEITSSSTITITGVVPETYTVTYMMDGKEVGTAVATFGQTFTESDKSTSWYLYDSDTPYDFTKGITGDTLFFAHPVFDSSKVKVDYYAPRGSIGASWLGGAVDNGETVLKGSEVTFTYDGDDCYSVVGWFIDGKYIETTDTSMTVTADKPVSLQIAVMYEQADYKYIVNAPMILSDEEYAKMLWIGNYKDPLTPAYDSNMPSGYTVVGDYLYLVSGVEILRIDLNADFSNGMPANTLKVEPKSVDKTIDYYGGYIFNGTHVYNLDLEYLVDVDATPVGMHDGAFVSLSNNRVTKYTIEQKGDGYESKTLWSLILEKHYGKVFFDGDYLYHLPVSTSSTQPDRAIQSIDLVNGKIKDTVNIDQWQYGHYYDDGWLTVYDGWAYIASYTSGLFGETNPYVTARNPVLLRVAVEDGMFDKDSVQTMELPNNTQQSGLIVYNDRGYIHSGDKLVVIDMKTFTVIYEETGTKTHGGIVLNTYYATPENDYTVYIYMIPYGGAENIWVYTDDQSKNSAGTPEKIMDIGYSQYALSHVRTSASGYIYYYNDSSIFFIAGQKYHEVSWIVDGEAIQTDSKAVNGSTLSIPDAPAKEGYAFMGWYNYDGTPVTRGSVVAGDMTIMAMYSPIYSDDEMVNSVTIKQFINGGKSVLISVDAGENAPEKVLLVTYSAYIDLPEGRILNPFITEAVEMTADQDTAVFKPAQASKVESVSITCWYKLGTDVYNTPYVEADAPAVSAVVDLAIDDSLTLRFNGTAVRAGDVVDYGYYTVEVEGGDASAYTVDGVAADGKARLFYYGQSLVVKASS